MPDILIRGMEMPTSCKCCPCYEQSLAFPDYIKRCKFGADLPQPWPLQYEKRGDNCPLVELQPHGDLIDRDALLLEYERDERAADEHGREFSFSFDSGGARCTEWWIVQQKLMDAPVVVQAEKGETQ